MEILKVRSSRREELVDITSEVSERIHLMGVKEGLCTLYVQHTTAGLTINENADPDVRRDILVALRKLVPERGMDFKHMEGNSDAHVKTSLFGSSLCIPVADGRLLLGRWQGIYLCDFDGPRERKVILMVR